MKKHIVFLAVLAFLASCTDREELPMTIAPSGKETLNFTAITVKNTLSLLGAYLNTNIILYDLP